MPRNGKKRVGNGGQPRTGKGEITDAEVGPASSLQQLFRWDTSMMDIGVSDDESCAWTWRLEPEDLRDLLEVLASCSDRTWAELEGDRTGREGHKKHHDQAVADLCAEAQARFYGFVTDESHDKLFRLRYGGRKRLWGIRDRAIFRIVWADLDHRVYPTDPN